MVRLSRCLLSVGLLSHEKGWRRGCGGRLLVEQFAAGVVPVVCSVCFVAAPPRRQGRTAVAPQALCQTCGAARDASNAVLFFPASPQHVCSCAVPGMDRSAMDAIFTQLAEPTPAYTEQQMRQLTDISTLR